MYGPVSSAGPASLAPGTVLAGKYRVERVLGEGGMGVVVLARHLDLDETVALKFLRAEFAQHAEAGPRFLREARAAVKIKSAHVARVLDVGRLEDDAPYMVMEFLQGSDLGAVIEQRGPLPIEDAVDYVIQAADALAEAHRLGIVHRDVKPSNLFLTSTDGQPVVKVLDFGISKMTEEAGGALTRTNTVMGSTMYMSPEQMEATRDVDGRTDVYALGTTLYELLAGRPAFDAETTPQLCALILKGASRPLLDLRAEVPPGLERVVRKAFALDRADRFPTMAAFAAALAPFAPDRSRETLAALARRDASPTIAPPADSIPRALPDAPTLAADTGDLATNPTLANAPRRGSRAQQAHATSAGVTKSSGPDLERPPVARTRTIVLAAVALTALGGLAAARLLEHGARSSSAAEVSTADPGPAVGVPARSATATPTVIPSATVASVASAATAEAAAVRHVRLVVLPADATVAIDGARAEVHDGVVDVAGTLGSVHHVTLVKDKGAAQGDVSITEAGAMPPKLEIVGAKPGVPGKGNGKKMRFGFDE